MDGIGFDRSIILSGAPDKSNRMVENVSDSGNGRSSRSFRMFLNDFLGGELISIDFTPLAVLSGVPDRTNE